MFNVLIYHVNNSLFLFILLNCDETISLANYYFIKFMLCNIRQNFVRT